MKLDFFDIFKKNSNIKFHENPSSWMRVCSMRTDGEQESRDEAFRNFANCLKNGRPYVAEKLQEFGLY
jgi:hypothetical protein